MVTIDAILLGGGMGRRFVEEPASGSLLPKQFHVLGNQPVWVHALRSLKALDCVRQFIFVVPSEFIEIATEQISVFCGDFPKETIRVVTGGERRQDSSRLALETLELSSPPPTRVLIHDACRPYLSHSFLMRIKSALFDRSYGAWIPVVPVVETIKRVENHQVMETVDRSLVSRVQTPQIFEFGVIRSLVERTREVADHNFTDDASLCEYYGIPVGAFDGDVRNIKLTYEFESEALKALLHKDAQTENASKKVLVDPKCDSESATIFTV